jgi:hypothetical protein
MVYAERFDTMLLYCGLELRVGSDFNLEPILDEGERETKY